MPTPSESTGNDVIENEITLCYYGSCEYFYFQVPGM